MRPTSALELYKAKTRDQTLRVGCEIIDGILGGIVTGGITEISGEKSRLQVYR